MLLIKNSKMILLIRLFLADINNKNLDILKENLSIIESSYYSIMLNN